MDYKKVIEEQIEELQKVQKEVIECGAFEIACRVAETIADLCERARITPAE